MSDLAISSLPSVSPDESSDTRVRLAFGRPQVLGLVFVVIGALIAFAIAPNLIDEQRTFAFEPPPDPLTFSFQPQTFVAVIGWIWIAAGVLSLAPLGITVPRRFTTIVQSVAGLTALPLVVALGLALSSSPMTNVTNLLDESLFLATPFILGSMTGLWCERSGIVNIGIEGQMLAAAGIGYMSYAVIAEASGTTWLWLGILIAVLAGGVTALLHALLTVTFQINQIVSGVVINLLALGLTGFLRSQVIVPSGFSSGQSTSDIAIPQLSHIPIVGPTLFTGRPIGFMAYGIVFLTWLVLYRTPWGLRVRACGEHPHAAETVGINVVKMRYQAVVVGGLIAGLGGAWFSMESQSGFEDNMTNSAGFIALAALIIGKWNPWGALAASILFGFTRALGSRLQFLKVSIGDFGIPSEFFQALPFMVTLVVVAGALGRAIAPAAEGQPYRPSK
ncbi:ABC transporter permease [Desertimonas flava]|uniref:ABC transporter permease n=1 Tax=Desertimonas flava TaxID=2064846 RepID=UPI000E349C70|nr:ABC transporter permease [Desertimonas flava]